MLFTIRLHPLSPSALSPLPCDFPLSSLSLSLSLSLLLFRRLDFFAPRRSAISHILQQRNVQCGVNKSESRVRYLYQSLLLSRIRDDSSRDRSPRRCVNEALCVMLKRRTDLRMCVQKTRDRYASHVTAHYSSPIADEIARWTRSSSN